MKKENVISAFAMIGIVLMFAFILAYMYIDYLTTIQNLNIIKK